MSYTLFSSLKPLPDDPILGLNEEFKKDARPEKSTLGSAFISRKKASCLS